MPTYRFHFHEDLAEEALEGVELESDAIARQEAIRTAREIMVDGILEGIDRTGWVARIYDEDDKVVATVNFADLLERRGHLE